MNQPHRPRDPAAFVAGRSDADSLADLVARLTADETLPPARRRDLASSLRRLAQLLDRDLSALPADLPGLRGAIGRINPAQYGISRKTWSNIRSNTLAALRLYGSSSAPSRKSPLSDEWQALQHRLPDKRFRNGLSRFTRFCSDQGIAPASVDDAATTGFRRHLETDTFVPKPSAHLRRTCRLWNEAVETISGWPGRTVPLPDNRKLRRRRALSDLPASFQQDLGAYLAMRANPDPFDEAAPDKPLKPGTIRLQQEHVRVAASALIGQEAPSERIRSLADLVEPNSFVAILRRLLLDHGGKANAWTEGIAKTLISIAKLWVRVDTDALNKLKVLQARLPKLQPGMTRKNRETLRQFDDDGNLARLLTLPQQLFAEALRVDPPTSKAAVQAQIAFAIEFLLHCPLRAHNLVALRLGTHLIRPAGNRGPVYLCLEPGEVKNDEPIDFELAPSVMKMLERYQCRFLAILGGPNCRHLFCTTSGQPKAQATLAQQIQKTIAKRLGLVMTMHQFRHLAAKLHLDADPDAYERLRQLLGHTSLRTTLNAYAKPDTRRAGKEHDRIIEARRQDLADRTSHPRRRATLARTQ
ncbi:MAG: site-specific integrase [Rhodospirillaceae bacterium]|nr:site-specific integrase [Rhodospirillaceae bacterium]